MMRFIESAERFQGGGCPPGGAGTCLGNSPSVAHLFWIELGEKSHVIGQFVNNGMMELESDPVAFLQQSIIQCIYFPEPAYSLMVIVTMLASGMLTDKNLLDVGRGIFDILAMFINVI
jgi:hypothetical protein